MKKTIVLITALALMTFGFAVSANAKTLDNLQTAYNGESNAHAKYLEFAKKADAEGYKGAAALFRAAAEAEKVHAAKEASVIRNMGAKPVAKIELPPVGTTAENLKNAFLGESYERDTMYPNFIKAARAENKREALMAFNYAKTAEGEHAKLYDAAQKDLNSMRAEKTFYVCTVCGYTTEKLDFARCPSCFAKRDKYVAVS